MKKYDLLINGISLNMPNSINRKLSFLLKNQLITKEDLIHAAFLENIANGKKRLIMLIARTHKKFTIKDIFNLFLFNKEESNEI